MPIIRGQITPAVPSIAILQCWEDRYGSEIAPEAEAPNPSVTSLAELSQELEVDATEIRCVGLSPSRAMVRTTADMPSPDTPRGLPERES